MDRREQVSISVIIPYYNNAKGLERLLKSIPAMDNIQVIIVDDCSTENIEDYNRVKNTYENRVLFLKTPCNSGAGAARNIGLKNATGDFLLFADSDDVFLDGAFDAVLSVADYSCDIVFFPPTSEYEDSNKISYRHQFYEYMVKKYIDETNRCDKDELFIRYHWLSPWSKLIKKELVVENEIFFDEIIVCNDVMFSTKCGYYAKSIKCCDKRIYSITCRNDSLTRTKNVEKYNVRVDKIINRYEYLNERLQQKQMNDLNLAVDKYVITSLLDGYGIRNSIDIIRRSKEKGVPIIKPSQSILKSVYQWIRQVWRYYYEKRIIRRSY